ncbi:MAG: hypothetical protein DRJ65_18665 [Acidobacteria bacterium]|nr:MAG: hypothetical protein DRJ65_18665 [Acidobacteriota bacterium]
MKVVISGLGVVMPGAWGWDEAESLFSAADPKPVDIDRSAGYHREGGSRKALLVDSGRMGEWLSPMAARRMSQASRFAVCASLMAFHDAGLKPQSEEGTTAVVMGTTYGAAFVTEKILRQILLEGPESVSPALFTESVANAPAAQIALAVGAKGANTTVTQRQASVIAALKQGVGLLMRGVADRVLVGVVDEMAPLLHSILDRFGGLARPEHNGAEVGRPFDARGSGWMGADGAAVTLLEPEDIVRRRGGSFRARVLGAGMAFDPGAPRSGWGTVPGPRAKALRAFLVENAVSPRVIDRVVCSAGGLPEADRLEARMIREVLGDGSLPPVLAPAASVGNHGAALLAGSVLAAAGATFGPTPGFGVPDREAGIIPHDGRTLPAPETVLMTVCAPGGSAGWALMARGLEV